MSASQSFAKSLIALGLLLSGTAVAVIGWACLNVAPAELGNFIGLKIGATAGAVGLGVTLAGIVLRDLHKINRGE